jgi:transcriptional regulator with XRE-family HTH domain
MTAALDIADLKAADVAKRLGLSRSYAHDLIKGNKHPSLSVAAQIEREFNVPVAAWATRIVQDMTRDKAA